MVQVFTPHRSIFVVASHPPHPEATEYRIAWGDEVWNGKPERVTKVQMVYSARVGGRLSPSYPDNTPDQNAVEAALEMLRRGRGGSNKAEKLLIWTKVLPISTEINDEIIEKAENEAEDFQLNKIMPSGRAAISPVISTEYEEWIDLGTDRTRENRFVGFVFKFEF